MAYNNQYYLNLNCLYIKNRISWWINCMTRNPQQYSNILSCLIANNSKYNQYNLQRKCMHYNWVDKVNKYYYYRDIFLYRMLYKIRQQTISRFYNLKINYNIRSQKLLYYWLYKFSILQKQYNWYIKLGKQNNFQQINICLNHNYRMSNQLIKYSFSNLRMDCNINLLKLKNNLIYKNCKSMQKCMNYNQKSIQYRCLYLNIFLLHMCRKLY